MNKENNKELNREELNQVNGGGIGVFRTPRRRWEKPNKLVDDHKTEDDSNDGGATGSW